MQPVASREGPLRYLMQIDQPMEAVLVSCSFFQHVLPLFLAPFMQKWQV